MEHDTAAVRFLLLSRDVQSHKINPWTCYLSCRMSADHLAVLCFHLQAAACSGQAACLFSHECLSARGLQAGIEEEGDTNEEASDTEEQEESPSESVGSEDVSDSLASGTNASEGASEYQLSDDDSA